MFTHAMVPARRALAGRKTYPLRKESEDALSRTRRSPRSRPASQNSASITRSWLTQKLALLLAMGSSSLRGELQLKEVPVIILDHLSETQKRAYILADNQLALNAGWDEDLLRVELAALQEEDFNINLVGFDDEELARLLTEQNVPPPRVHGRRMPCRRLPQTPVSASGRSLDPRDPQAARWRRNESRRRGEAHWRRSGRPRLH